MAKYPDNTPQTGFVKLPGPIGAWLRNGPARRGALPPTVPLLPELTESLDVDELLHAGPPTIDDAYVRLGSSDDGRTTSAIANGYDRDQTISRSYFYVTYARVGDDGGFENMIVDVEPLLWQAHHARRGGAPIRLIFWAPLPQEVLSVARDLGIPFASLPIQVIG